MTDVPIVLQIAAKALIVRSDGKVLLLRESPKHSSNTKAGQYHLVGGRLEPGETFVDALRREVMEETGLTVEIGKPLLVGEWRPVIHGVPHQIVGVFVSAEVVAGTARLSSEHDDLQWIDPNDFTAWDIVMPDRDAIAAYVA